MSDKTPDRKTDPTTALEQFAPAVQGGKFSQALIWLNTASLLDEAADKLNPQSPVNTACLELAIRALDQSDLKVAHCGHVLPEHGKLLEAAQEALSILTKRLPVTEPLWENGKLMLTHLASARESLKQFFTERQVSFVFSTNADAQVLVDTVVACRKLLADSGVRNSLVTEGQRVHSARTALANAKAHVPGFPCAWLANYEEADFMVRIAQRMLSETPEAGGELAANADTLNRVLGSLAAASAACKGKKHSLSRQHLGQAAANINRIGYLTTPSGL